VSTEKKIGKKITLRTLERVMNRKNTKIVTAEGIAF
jgi:hypothetical protein